MILIMHVIIGMGEELFRVVGKH